VSDIVITGTGVRAATNTAGGADQYVREARATAVGALNTWTASTTATAPQIAADATRVGLLIVSAATGIVYLRFDSTAPVPATPAYHWLLQPGDRYEVPIVFVQLAVSMVASVGGGVVLSTLATAG
jgi:hypothetical protein